MTEQRWREELDTGAPEASVIDLDASSARHDAASARDKAAQARDVASSWAGAAREVAGDRVAAALDRHAAALRAATASAIDIAVEVRLATAALVNDEERAAGDRAAAALDRRDAAVDRFTAADELQLAYRDDLTGALLRDAGCEQLSAAADRAHRTGEPLVFAFLDVDHLKELNDTAGHQSGDVLLRVVGTALRRGLRTYDVVVRYGGDEFVCALPGSGLTEARKRFGHVEQLIREAMPEAGVSVGLAELRVGEGAFEAVARADTEMYRARRLGRGSSGR